MKIGIFGGTFDPPHFGHITIAKCFINECLLDMCYFVPNKRSPFKLTKENMLNDQERINAITKMLKNNDKMKICDYEISKDAISYSIDTVQYFKREFSHDELFLLIGEDQALHFNKWRHYEQILEICNIIIARRPEMLSNEAQIQIKNIFQNAKCQYLSNPIINITSSLLRAEKNKSVRFLL